VSGIVAAQQKPLHMADTGRKYRSSTSPGQDSSTLHVLNVDLSSTTVHSLRVFNIL
jgi:hypothetical protein